MKIFKILLLCLICSTYMYGQMEQPTKPSGNTVIVKMAALDQPFMYNRLGTAQPTGMIFALESDIVIKDNSRGRVAGNVTLKEGKRPRPIVLRANVGDQIQIHFTNYLRPYKDKVTKQSKKDGINPVTFYGNIPTLQTTVNPIYPATRQAGVHIIGTNLVKSISDDASNVGSNKSSLVDPNGKAIYTLFADAEGTFVLHSTADNIADGTIRAGQISNGLFGSLIVEPPGAEWYRSQVPEEDLYNATQYWMDSKGIKTFSKPVNPTPAQLIAFKQKTKGFPYIDYTSLRMYKQVSPTVRELTHTDLTALITGPNAGDFVTMKDGEYTSPSFLPVPATPNRQEPYREFSIHYHEAPYAVQAFPAFYDNTLKTFDDTMNNITQTIQGGVDQFAFNYGTGGIGAEIYANRVNVGPMKDCIDCAYEEFFLSAWAVGDPAQVVDVPANAGIHPNQSIDSTLQELMLMEADLLGGAPVPVDRNAPNEMRATKVFFPDDPSNVYHSYMNDHVKFRINHCGAGITHVHHQHAHQWLHSPNSSAGHYLDSQTINPGTSYTLEMVFGGSGNLNKTVGDQIFHCHFYPHFAQGMWAMWRVHDVLESGTVMAPDGTVAPQSRAYPDGEILQGTPIPGLVPISNKAMAPIPARVHIENGQIVFGDDTVSPGFPFYIPGVAGQRVPHPPLDFARGDVTTIDNVELKDTLLNGGLPRNVIIDGDVVFTNESIYDWSKITEHLKVIELPESGTYYEKLAMAAHATRNHFNPNPRGGTRDTFFLNGLPPVSGAPYADPRVNLQGEEVGTLRRYKAANIQVDAVLNELGWHYPQQRPIVLWGDVASTVAGDRPPEPFIFRANSDEYIEFWSTNLVPEYYELDDYQVRTPTDVIGQHIHLVKFDVTSSDGAANGWNYEDGTLAPELVVGHIGEINDGGIFYSPDLSIPFTGTRTLKGQANSSTINTTPLVAYKPNPIWGPPPSGQKPDSWNGAQTTIQRWYSNPLDGGPANPPYDLGKDRTLRTVFTHDHFGPSTHQQIGLYAGLLIEPKDSDWLNSSTGKPLGFATNGETRNVKLGKVSDGGPTDWQAIISDGQNGENSYREFMFEFQDNQQAYLAGSNGSMNIPYPEYYSGLQNNISFRDSVNHSYRGWLQDTMAINPPPLQNGLPAPELVTTGNRGTLSVNYRNSPLPVRVAPGGGTNSSDMAYAFSSDIKRGVKALNSQPTGGAKIASGSVNDFTWPKQPLSPGMQGGDPYTPLARAYSGDRIQIRTLVGAHVNPHFFNVHGVKWYFEPSFTNSGYRSTQMMSLSEHFEMNFKLPYAFGNKKDGSGTTDYLYVTNADDTGLQAGTFGFMRSYNEKQSNLYPLPNNEETFTSGNAPDEKGCGCPPNAPVKNFEVTAISIDQYQQGGPDWGKLVYNQEHRNFDLNAIVFVDSKDINDFKYNADYVARPLVMRANAGDCVKVTLRNEITPGFAKDAATAVKYAGAAGNTYSYETSFTVGMHAELVNYDVSQSDGTTVGFNNEGQLLPQTDGRGKETVDYEWYAGQWISNGNNFSSEAVELGTCVLTGPDALMQYVKGMFGALIIEPKGSFAVQDQFDPTSANVYASESDFTNGEAPLFREFVLMFQDNISSLTAEPAGNSTGAPVTSGLNYKSEPLANRVFFDATSPTINFNQVDVSAIVSNEVELDAPETPTFAAVAGTPVRFRVMYPGGAGDGSTFDLHGHVWQEEPYINNSTELGFNVESQWIGARGQLGALNSFDLLINSAGGAKAVPGQYLYRDYRNQTFQDGIWGIFQVTEGKDTPMLTRVTRGSKTTFSGRNSVDPNTGKFAKSVTVSAGKTVLGTPSVSAYTGEWSLTINSYRPGGLKVTSKLDDGSTGGSVSYTLNQVNKLTHPPRKRVRMVPVRRSPAKTIEPGSNKKGVIQALTRLRRK